MKKYSIMFDEYYIKFADEYIKTRKFYYWKRRIFIIDENTFKYIYYKDFMKFVSNDSILNDASHLMASAILARLKEISKYYPENLKRKLAILKHEIYKFQFKKQNCNIKRFDLDL